MMNIDILETVYEQQKYMFEKFGLGLLLTKREDTTNALIVLSVISMNIDHLAAMLLLYFKFFSVNAAIFSQIELLSCNGGLLRRHYIANRTV